MSRQTSLLWKVVELARGGPVINGASPSSLRKIPKLGGGGVVEVNLYLIDQQTNEWMHVIIYFGLICSKTYYGPIKAFF